MARLQRQVSDILLEGARAAVRAGALPAGIELPEATPVVRPKRAEWGDYSSPLALGLARDAGMPPLEVADAIRAHTPDSALVGELTVTSPGFLNVVLSPSWLASQVDAIIAAGGAYADLDEGGGRKAQVEYVSANPTGPLTVGHGRGGVIGDTLANLLTASGYDVVREYYYNNAGRQMDRLGDSARRRYMQALGHAAEMPEDAYVGEYLVDLARDLVREHGEALLSEPAETFKDLAERVIAEGQRRSMDALGIHMDVWFNERTLYEEGLVWQALEGLRQSGYVYERDGATWLRATELGGPEDRVLVRSTGEPTYRLPDIAYHVNKLERGFELIVDVLGADHKDAFPDVVRGLEALGHDTAGLHVLLNQFVTFKGGRMSKRAGHFTTLDELIEEVGGDVARYFLLMRAPETHLEFDLDLARERSDTNPVYYVQYAHARLSSILRLADERGHASDGGDASLLVHPSEQALIRRLLELSDVIHLAVVELSPHHLATYSRDLASDLHAFYRDCRVLDPDDEDLTRARLRLVLAAKVGLATVLQLLGVSAPEEM